jgi:hypothetical protein
MTFEITYTKKIEVSNESEAHAHALATANAIGAKIENVHDESKLPF